MKSWCVALFALVLVFGCQKKADGVVAPTGFTVSGVILEKLDAQDSSYLRIGTESGEVWAKVPPTDLAQGADVSVVQAQEVLNWESPKLQRTFDRLYIGKIEAQGAAGVAPQGMGSDVPQGMAQAMRQMGDGAAAGASVPKQQKAPGADGRTIAEILANGQSLNGKTVSVRGQVVRATPGLNVPNIAGGLWVHIQDGTGDPAQGTHDLTVATDEDVKVGDILVFQGNVTTDGAGFLSGRVIVQGAKKVKP